MPAISVNSDTIGTTDDEVFNLLRGNYSITGGGGSDTYQLDNRGAGLKTFTDFDLGDDTLSFRIDGHYFEGTSIKTINNNSARVDSAADFCELIATVVSDDGANNSVVIDGDTVVVTIDADNHFRGDLTLEFEGLVPQLYEGLTGRTAGANDDVIVGTGGDDVLHAGGGAPADGDDIIITGSGKDTVAFSGNATNNNNLQVPIDVICDLQLRATDADPLQDKLSFSQTGSFFGDLDPANPGSDSKAYVVDSLADLQDLVDYLNNDGPGGTRGDEGSAVVDGNDLVLTFDYREAAGVGSGQNDQIVVLEGFGDQMLV